MAERDAVSTTAKTATPSSTVGTPPLQNVSSTTNRGLTVRRFFTRPGIHPFDEIEWELRTASIQNEKGQNVFEQRSVEVPKDWSQTATNIVASKYFHGKQGSSERESSARQLISRVADTIEPLAYPVLSRATVGRRCGLGSPIVHERIRRFCRRNQVGREDPAGG